MSGVSNQEMEMMQRIDVSGTDSLGYFPVIDGKTQKDAPCFDDLEDATNWALGYLTALEEEKAKPTNLVPGEMYCAKCNFSLIRTNLYVNNGTAGPGDNKTEPCPNGCGPLWPVTWEKSARDCWKRLEQMFEEKQALQKDADRLNWLNRMNVALNQHYRTTYKWKLILSPNVVRLMSGNFGSTFIDLNDAECGPGSQDDIRKAIDDGMRERA